MRKFNLIALVAALIIVVVGIVLVKKITTKQITAKQTASPVDLSEETENTENTPPPPTYLLNDKNYKYALSMPSYLPNGVNYVKTRKSGDELNSSTGKYLIYEFYCKNGGSLYIHQQWKEFVDDSANYKAAALGIKGYAEKLNYIKDVKMGSYEGTLAQRKSGQFLLHFTNKDLFVEINDASCANVTQEEDIIEIAKSMD